MNKDFIKIPQLGVNDETATIVEWFFNDGQHVNKGDILFSVETTKANNEIESEFSGILNILIETNNNVGIDQIVGILYENVEVFNDQSISDKNKYNKVAEENNLIITKKAKTLIDKYNIDIKPYFDNGIVKEKDILLIVEKNKNRKKIYNYEPNKNNLLIWGAGQGGYTVFETIVSSNKDINMIGYIDDDANKTKELYNGYPVFTKNEIFKNHSNDVFIIFVAISNSEIRKKTNEWLKNNENIQVINAIHPNSYISPSVKLGVGCHIKSGAIIESNSKIDDGCIIDNNVTIAHDNLIQEYSHLAPGVSLGSNIYIGSKSIIGIGVSISTGVKIGEKCIVSTGSSVTKNFDNNTIIEGVPGRKTGIRK